jgi:transposase-like protein
VFTPEQRRRFSAQFKAEAVQMVIETGKPIASVARDLGIHEWSTWRRRMQGRARSSHYGANLHDNDHRKQTMTRMTQWQLPLDGVDEARSLHRMLFEVKFDETPADTFLGSPHIAAIEHRLIDMLTDAEPTKRWDEWRRADRHPHRVEKIRRHLQQSTAWPNTSIDMRRQSVYLKARGHLREIGGDELVEQLGLGNTSPKVPSGVRAGLLRYARRGWHHAVRRSACSVRSLPG